MFLFVLVLAWGCTPKPKIFVLQDVGNEKYYLLDTIQKKRKSGILANAPIVAIDGIEFKYDSKSDTIVLPLFGKEISGIDFLHQDASHIVYGKNEKEGAIIITTTAKAETITTDTIYSN